jgi:hypothetical protein
MGPSSYEAKRSTQSRMDRSALLTVLERDGVLLVSDPLLPSVTSLVVGASIGGSWWGHPRGNEIYHLVNQLAEHPHVLMVKLVSAKVTFVHRRLWPAVVGVGQSRADWQLDGLTQASKFLLRLVDESGRLAWDDIPPFLPPDHHRASESVRALDTRLLVHATEVHTASGAHARNLETWPSWIARVDPHAQLPNVTDAQRQLESVMDTLNSRYGAAGRLPWHKPVRRKQAT